MKRLLTLVPTKPKKAGAKAILEKSQGHTHLLFLGRGQWRASGVPNREHSGSLGLGTRTQGQSAAYLLGAFPDLLLPGTLALSGQGCHPDTACGRSPDLPHYYREPELSDNKLLPRAIEISVLIP